ncbi:uncharacterized protein [Penaeus vannamei]|uniref:uncharacterized protein n=1 Tax=Penaeus vannamei TaxID=6689 RepID=UPI00387F7B64
MQTNFDPIYPEGKPKTSPPNEEVASGGNPHRPPPTLPAHETMPALGSRAKRIAAPMTITVTTYHNTDAAGARTSAMTTPPRPVPTRSALPPPQDRVTRRKTVSPAARPCHPPQDDRVTRRMAVSPAARPCHPPHGRVTRRTTVSPAAWPCHSPHARVTRRKTVSPAARPCHPPHDRVTRRKTTVSPAARPCHPPCHRDLP